MNIKDVMDKFTGKGVPWGPTLTPSAAEELKLYLLELTREVYQAGFEAGRNYAFEKDAERHDITSWVKDYNNKIDSQNPDEIEYSQRFPEE